MSSLDKFQQNVLRGRALCDEIAKSHPSLQRDMVWCRKCGNSRKVDAAECLRSGWPKCPCNGHTMTIDPPSTRGD